MLAKLYLGQDVKGWLMSEKLDGIRALWNGERLVSRNNKPIYAPEWFIKPLPKSIQLDGELCLGRGKFQHTVSVVRKKYVIEDEWRDLIYYVFDVMEDLPYEERIKKVPCNLNLLPWTICKDKQHIFEYYNVMLAHGAEGVMIRNPKATYEYKRTVNLLKLKPSYDSEAEVIGYQEGEGKHLGRLGALICDWNGVRFKVGTGFSDAQREDPPQVGDIITFRYQTLTDLGLPRFPVFWKGGERDEV